MQSNIEKTLSEAIGFANWLHKADEGTVEVARTIARTMDELLTSGDVQTMAKGAYLAPHLMTYIRALGLSPEGRKQLEIAVDQGVNMVDELKLKRKQKQTRDVS